ncbi:response regulator [Granulibacter bethesdensis]|uniref:response regulator n=1 Tax=Granulibacter bethesdensis TaxID=364410 RepID=UPI000A58797C|nr:response regulator [Granulibacter bethesdensis]
MRHFGRFADVLYKDYLIILKSATSVLLVDDDGSVRDVILAGLLGRGFVVAAAESGESALELLRGHGGFDVVISDICMPGMSGFELRKKVMALYPDTYFILISGYTDGVPEPVPILRKPFRLSQLEDRIRSWQMGSQQQ